MPALEVLLSQAERIGVIGSPSSTLNLTLDILATAVEKKLVGEFAFFPFRQEGKPHYALGQITHIEMRNVWHEEPTMRSLIRQRGRVDAVSERQDTHTAKMIVSAVFTREGLRYKDSQLGTVPSTGTAVYLVKDEILEELLKDHQEEIFYLGRAYGSKPLLPMWFKHFDSGRGGAGEAYHIGIFGKTGSGKSSLAKMLLVAYARHRNMGLLVLDPQGEFSKEFSPVPPKGSFTLPMPQLMKNLGRSTHIVKVRDLVLDRWELFEEILFESKFFEQLSIPKGENRKLAVETLRGKLQQAKVRLEDLWKEETFHKAWKILGEEENQRVFYRSEGSRERFRKAREEANAQRFYQQYWLPVTQLFRAERGKKVEQVLAQLFSESNNLQSRPLVVIDLSAEGKRRQDISSNLFNAEGDDQSPEEPEVLWNDRIQLLVIRRFLQGIQWLAEKSYKEGRSLNTLVLIDEAHRLAPREGGGTETEVGHVAYQLLDAVRTTRKYGLGWLFISQTLSSLHREIISQLRLLFFGFGLGMGAELRALNELIGGREEALELYRLFRDPHASFDEAHREYSFMTIGPVSPLSFAGTPLFFNAFNEVEDFLRYNKLSDR